ncbi:histidine kinase [Olivibacter sp. 47]|jgi:sensor histidine kinase YesM|uniref:sensor histidine kinase n=1 Tax=Olivibacter sp. 47 TaxID=3056486 RepID=UPI0025A45E9C|nr:histidine kinase [Olivibacter sp. 47]MDM8175962.1 histidine kinase [Olivibacter sp. 47]
MQSIGTFKERENDFLCSIFYGKWPNIFILWYDEPKKPEDMVAFFRKHPFLFNILCWVIYVQFVYIYNLPKIDHVDYFHIIGLCFLYAIVFYSNFFLFKFIENRKTNLGTVILMIASVFFTLAALGYLAVYNVFPLFGIRLYYEGVPFTISLYLRNILSPYIKYASYAIILYFVLKWFADLAYKRRMEKAHYEMEREKFEYEQAFLRAQVNPHFLHNTLNFIYTEALALSKSLAESIYLLSIMMRYSLDNAIKGKQLVPVHKELEYLEIYLEINRRRFGGGKQFHYEFNGDPYLHSIPPLSFITLVENAFKYGDLSDPMYPLQIKIAVDRNRIYFYCTNKKRGAGKLDTSANHIGLKNVERRLKGAFRERATMTRTEEDNTYTVELFIDFLDNPK